MPMKCPAMLVAHHFAPAFRATRSARPDPRRDHPDSGGQPDRHESMDVACRAQGRFDFAKWREFQPQLRRPHQRGRASRRRSTRRRFPNRMCASSAAPCATRWRPWPRTSMLEDMRRVLLGPGRRCRHRARPALRRRSRAAFLHHHRWLAAGRKCSARCIGAEIVLLARSFGWRSVRRSLLDALAAIGRNA